MGRDAFHGLGSGLELCVPFILHNRKSASQSSKRGGFSDYNNPSMASSTVVLKTVRDEHQESCTITKKPSLLANPKGDQHPLVVNNSLRLVA